MTQKEIDAIAEVNCAAMLQNNPWLGMDELMARLTKAANENASKKARFAKIIRIADEALDAAAPYIACGRGCAACCYGPVSLIATEAERIAAFSGRKMTRLPVRPLDVVEKSEKRFSMMACPFLGPDNLCAIYDVRPMMCRNNHSLASDPALCDPQTSGGLTIPSYLGLRAPEYFLSTLMGKDEPRGDIREFFPPESPR